MITRGRHYRSVDFGAVSLEQSEETMIVEGLAAVFGQETVIWEYEGVEYKEKIDPSAFDGADMSDVVFVVDHTGKPAAKTRNKTLQLFVKPDGLYMRADVSKNATGREFYEDAQNGFYDKMSFSFSVSEDSYDRDTRTRTIRKIKKLYDVSAVTFPAYEQTQLIARSWAEAQRDIEATEAANKEAEASKRSADALELERLRAKVLAKF